MTLKRMVPGGVTSIAAIKDDNGKIHMDNDNIARCLNVHWQSVFGGKGTDKHLRQAWLNDIRDRFKTDLKDLRPTAQDIDRILAHLPQSAEGPTACHLLHTRSASA